MARTGKIELFTSAQLLAELEDVLNRRKLVRRLASAGVTAHDLVLGYAALAVIVAPAIIEPVVLADKDDDAVIACAVAAQSEVIVSGDSHLVKLSQYGHIRILTAARLIEEIS
jgi:putative PIN family toxin of toxin-antitoxin system